MKRYSFCNIYSAARSDDADFLLKWKFFNERWVIEDNNAYIKIRLLDERGINFACIYPEDEQIENENLFGITAGIISNIQKLFEDFSFSPKSIFDFDKIDNKYIEYKKNIGKFFDFKPESIFDREIDFICNMIVELFIRYLLADGWELMDREGYWFRKEDQ